MNFQKTLMSFDHYFGKMEGLVKDKKVPARVRFLIQDVIDLRKRNWIPRTQQQVWGHPLITLDLWGDVS